MTRPVYTMTGVFKTAMILMHVCFVGISSSKVEKPSKQMEERCAAADMPVASRKVTLTNMAFLIGAQKSGTTFLFDELVGRHTKIRCQVISVKSGRDKLVKEPQFFAEQPLMNFDKYLRSFTNGSSDPTVTYLDGTPSYLPIPAAANRIASAFPAARIVAVLRDPVDRALSQWNMQRTRGRKSLIDHGTLMPGTTARAFDQLVYEELEMLRASNCSFEPSALSVGVAAPPAADVWTRTSGLPGWNECNKCVFRCGNFQWKEGSDPSSGTCKFLTNMLVRRGLYVYQLEWWLQHFKPEQLLVINQEELYADPDEVLKRVVSFLGQDPEMLLPKREVKSGWSLPKEQNTMQIYATVIAELYRYFEHANEELYRLMATMPASGWKGRFRTELGGKPILS